MQASRLVILTFSIFCSCVIHAQIPQGSAARTTPSELQRTSVRVDQLITLAEDHFRRGQLDLVDGKREKARDEFDKAIDVILESGLDVRASLRLQTFYLDLVERIYRAEVPNIPMTIPSSPVAIAQNANPQLQSPSQPQGTASLQIGFRQQQFEPMPLDQLGKLMTPEDLDKLQASTPKCNANMLRTISLRGLRLGMTVNEVKRLLPGLKIDAMNEFGYRQVIFASTRLRDPRVQQIKNAALRDIQIALLKFMDSRLTEIYIAYDNSVKWSSSDEFASVVANRLALRELPIRSGQLRSIRCGTLTLIAGLETIDGKRLPTTLLYDHSAEDLILGRVRASVERQRLIKSRLEEEKKKNFKP